jgi:hypothetical protein
LGAVPNAAAQERAWVVVAEFTGPKKLAEAARQEVVRVLTERYDLIPVKKYREARKAAGGAPESADDFKQIGKEVGANAIVTGAATKSGRRFSLELAVRTAADGEVVDKTEIEVRRARRLRRPEKRAIEEQTIALMESFEFRWQAIQAEAAKVEGEGEGEGEAKGEGEGEAEGGAEGEVETRSDGGGAPLVRGTAYAGFAFIGRTLRFDVSDAIPDAMLPADYSVALAPGFRIAGDVYPFAQLGDAFADVGVNLGLDRSLFLNSELGNQDFGTAQTRFGIGLLYDYALGVKLGKSGAPVVLRGAFGFERLSFSIDSGDVDTGLPDVAYSYLDLGAGALVPFMKDLAAVVDFRFLIGLSAGEITEMQAYGGGGVSGFDFDIGAQWSALAPILVRGGLRFQRMGIGFDGDGALAEIDGDGVPDVSGASDTFFGLYATAGYQF